MVFLKSFLLFIGLLLGLALFTINLKFITPAHSETIPGTKLDVFEQKKLVKSVVFAIGVNEYYIDGKFPGVTIDARPFIQDGRTFVPIRFLTNALGVQDKSIFWDDDVKKVTLTAWNKVEMIVGSTTIAITPGDTKKFGVKTIDVAPIINENEGRTYLPARYVAEGLGYEVDWEDNTETVLCWPIGEAKPDVAAVRQYVEAERKKIEAGEQKPTESTTEPFSALPKVQVDESLAHGAKIHRGYDGGSGYDTTPTKESEIPWVR
ncbi:MAG: copper amine oxidase N-terminal domain-containing protein [Firmicutes bacterium]|nr:copper amine oxidase N-terminal domain-containing protein [Bacillota bacterium]